MQLQQHFVSIVTDTHVRHNPSVHLIEFARPSPRVLARMSFKKQNPSDFLKLIIGKPVVVKLNSGVDYRGRVATSVLEWVGIN